MRVSASLFDAPAGSVFGSAGDWVIGTLFGSVAVALCIIAVAFVGLIMMTGRLAIRDGVRVVIGCFVLLGAPTIASGLRMAASDAASGPVPQEVFPASASRPVALPPRSDDP